MTTEQIYTLVNEVNKQAFGENALQVVDTSRSLKSEVPCGSCLNWR